MIVTPAEGLLSSHGVQRDLGAHVVAAAFNGSGQAAFGLGDGTIWFPGRDASEWQTFQVFDGSVLDLTRDASRDGFLCGGDDGGFVSITADGVCTDVARWPGKWVEHVAASTQLRDQLRACSVGKRLHLFDANGSLLKTLVHPSTVTGIAFDSKGKRVTAAHYNGVSIWYTLSDAVTPRRLEWKGSHTSIAWHPLNEAVVTAMQENALHGWRLADGQPMQMSGYPSKSESLSFTANGKWLASSGADMIVLWPFFGGGPLGKAPIELGCGTGVLCTRVACHPRHDLCAAGFADGMVVIADLKSQKIRLVAPPCQHCISALAWSDDGGKLAFGTEAGSAAIVEVIPS